MRDGVAAAMMLGRYRLSKTASESRTRRPTQAMIHGAPVMVSGFALWRGVATPSYIKEQIESLATDAASLQISGLKAITLAKNAGLDVSTMQAFQTGSIDPLVTTILSFAANHDHWYNNLWGSTLETVNDYKAKLVATWDAAKDYGIDLSGVARPQEPRDFGDDSLGKPAAELWKAGKFIIYAGIVIIAIFALMGVGPSILRFIRH